MGEAVVAGGTSRRLSPPAIAAIVATLVAILPALVVAVTYAGHRYLPLGDYAVIDSRVRDVWSSDFPLLGMYSRFGWYHPGPGMFWALAPLSLVAGKAAWATLVGAALLQASAVVWSARVAWTRGRLVLVLAVLAAQTLSYVGIDEFLPLQRPWNPFVAFPFFALFILLVWSAGLGEVRQIPWVILVGSFLIQTHVGYALLVVVGFGWVAFFTLRRRKDPELAGQWRRPLLWSTVILGAMWIVPLAQTVTRRGRSNVVRLVKYFVFGDDSLTFIPQFSDQAIGFPVAPQIFAAEFHWLPPWLGGPSLASPSAVMIASPVSLVYLLVPIVLLVAGYVFASRARNRSAVHAVLLAALFGVVGIFALSRVRGEPTDFVFYWRITLAVFIVMASIGAVLTTVRWWKLRAVRVATAVVLSIAIVVPTVAMSSQVLDGDPGKREAGRLAASFVEQVGSEAARTGPVLLLSSDAEIGLGVFDELDRQGQPVYLSRENSDRLFEGRHRAAPGAVRSIWYLVGGAKVSLLAGMPQARELASISPFPPETEARLREVQYTLAGQLRAAGRRELQDMLESDTAGQRLEGIEGVDQSLVRELLDLRSSLDRAKYRYAIFAFPPDQPPPGFHVPFEVL